MAGAGDVWGRAGLYTSVPALARRGGPRRPRHGTRPGAHTIAIPPLIWSVWPVTQAASPLAR